MNTSEKSVLNNNIKMRIAQKKSKIAQKICKY